MSDLPLCGSAVENQAHIISGSISFVVSLAVSSIQTLNYFSCIKGVSPFACLRSYEFLPIYITVSWVATVTSFVTILDHTVLSSDQLENSNNYNATFIKAPTIMNVVFGQALYYCLVTFIVASMVQAGVGKRAMRNSVVLAIIAFVLCTFRGGFMLGFLEKYRSSYYPSLLNVVFFALISVGDTMTFVYLRWISVTERKSGLPLLLYNFVNHLFQFVVSCFRLESSSSDFKCGISLFAIIISNLVFLLVSWVIYRDSLFWQGMGSSDTQDLADSVVSPLLGSEINPEMAISFATGLADRISEMKRVQV